MWLGGGTFQCYSIECGTFKSLGNPLHFGEEDSLLLWGILFILENIEFPSYWVLWGPEERGRGSPESSCPCPCLPVLPPQVPQPEHGRPWAARWLSPPSALQALKKDGGVPWTGMLAIVHSYVTHKTGETSGQLGRGSDTLLFNPALGLLDSLWAQQRLF